MPQHASPQHPHTPEIPPSLLSLRDTLERHADARMPLLHSELARRESETILLKSHRLLLRMQLWSALQTSVIAGLVIFSFGAAFSGLVQVSKTVQRVDTWSASLGGNPLTRGFQQEIDGLVPTSKLLEFADRVPFWDIGDATRLSVLVAIGILTLHIVQSAAHWRTRRRLKEQLGVLKNEMTVLRSWMHKNEKPLS